MHVNNEIVISLPYKKHHTSLCKFPFSRHIYSISYTLTYFLMQPTKHNFLSLSTLMTLMTSGLVMSSNTRINCPSLVNTWMMLLSFPATQMLFSPSTITPHGDRRPGLMYFHTVVPWPSMATTSLVLRLLNIMFELVLLMCFTEGPVGNVAYYFSIVIDFYYLSVTCHKQIIEIRCNATWFHYCFIGIDPIQMLLLMVVLFLNPFCRGKF